MVQLLSERKPRFIVAWNVVVAIATVAMVNLDYPVISLSKSMNLFKLRCLLSRFEFALVDMLHNIGISALQHPDVILGFPVSEGVSIPLQSLWYEVFLSCLRGFIGIFKFN